MSSPLLLLLGVGASVALGVFVSPLLGPGGVPTDAPRPAPTVVSGPEVDESDPADPDDYPTPPPSTDPDRPRVSMISRGAPGEADVWRDSETGCQYLSYRKHEPAFHVRYTAEGRPWCGLPAGGSR